MTEAGVSLLLTSSPCGRAYAKGLPFPLGATLDGLGEGSETNTAIGQAHATFDDAMPLVAMNLLPLDVPRARTQIDAAPDALRGLALPPEGVRLSGRTS